MTPATTAVTDASPEATPPRAPAPRAPEAPRPRARKRNWKIAEAIALGLGVLGFFWQVAESVSARASRMSVELQFSRAPHGGPITCRCAAINAGMRPVFIDEFCVALFQDENATIYRERPWHSAPATDHIESGQLIAGTLAFSDHDDLRRFLSSGSKVAVMLRLQNGSYFRFDIDAAMRDRILKALQDSNPDVTYRYNERM